MTELMERYEAERGGIMPCGMEIPGGFIYSKEYVTWLEDQLTWRPASELPEEDQTVLATYLNQCGKRRRVRAVYIGQYEEEVDDDREAGYEYSEEHDLWYLEEGWYELIDNWDTYTSVAVVEGVVDYWLPIPPAPKGD